ncbi:hypothetical protein [uncultured Aquitalea sp.]|uniref:hypothetical protein n=1 Tax=uncultured Aquitalea sp. TaxID=540272 RepID=UPI0025FFD207|nr:hypothetical protein [uncultured Aquitalea sp.]
MKLSKLKALEEELNSYLYGVVSAWHQGVMPTESEVWSHVESVFSRVDSDRDRQQLQMNTVDLLGEALTYIRLDG